MGHVLSFDVAGVHDQVIEPRELDQVALLERYCTPHPLKTFDDPIALTGPVGGALPKVYIQCVDPVYAPLQSSRDCFAQRARSSGERHARCSGSTP